MLKKIFRLWNLKFLGTGNKEFHNQTLLNRAKIHNVKMFYHSRNMKEFLSFEFLVLTKNSTDLLKTENIRLGLIYSDVMNFNEIYYFSL